MEEKNKRDYRSIIITSIIGTFFVIAFIVLMAIICYYSKIIHEEASEAGRRCDPEVCSYASILDARISELAFKSYIAFGLCLLFSICFVLLPSFIFKEKKKESRIIASSFIKLFLAFSLSDFALMFTAGRYVSWTSESDSVLEYLIYSLDFLGLLTVIFFIVDLTILCIRKKSFIFFKTNSVIFGAELVGIMIGTGVSILVVSTLCQVHYVMAFAIVQIIAIPILIALEITILGLKIISAFFTDTPKKRHESKEEY